MPEVEEKGTNAEGVEERPKEIDQITKEFEPPEVTKKPKKKDPKKVAAGKALAKRNKEAREAKRKMDEANTETEGGMLSNIGIGTMIGIGGLALGVGNLYLRWKEDQSRVATAESRTKEETEAEPKEPEGKSQKIKRMEEENGLI